MSTVWLGNKSFVNFSIDIYKVTEDIPAYQDICLSDLSDYSTLIKLNGIVQLRDFDFSCMGFLKALHEDDIVEIWRNFGG